MSIDEGDGRRRPSLTAGGEPRPGARGRDGEADTGDAKRSQPAANGYAGAGPGYAGVGPGTQRAKVEGSTAAADEPGSLSRRPAPDALADALAVRMTKRRRRRRGGGPAARPAAMAAPLLAEAPAFLGFRAPALEPLPPYDERLAEALSQLAAAADDIAAPGPPPFIASALPFAAAAPSFTVAAPSFTAAGAKPFIASAPPFVASPAFARETPLGRGEERGRAPVYAALDLGTNNCRLLLAVPTRPGQFRVIDAFSRIVRLGEGLGRTGRLGGPAMDRAIAALSICSQKLAARTIVGARLIATEACRAAANGADFIDRVRRETGLDLEIVSRETEARLAVSGCGSLVERSARGAVLFDIGGGSSEIALLDLRGGYTPRLSNHIVAWTSLPVGVVTLAERYGGRDVPPALFEAMVEEVVQMIGGFEGRDRLAGLVGGDHFHLLGTSGTVTTLAGIHLRLERYDRRQVDGLWLTDTEVDELTRRLAGWSFEERVANPCIGSDRADLVLAGCAILEAIRRVWPARALRVADRGLREGLLTEMMVADGVWRRGAPVRPQVPA